MHNVIYFIPQFASSCCKFIMKLFYVSVFVLTTLMFIIGISRTNPVFVGISIGILLCAVCFGICFSRCYDYCYSRRSQKLTPEKKYGTKYLVPVYYTDFEDQQV